MVGRRVVFPIRKKMISRVDCVTADVPYRQCFLVLARKEDLRHQLEGRNSAGCCGDGLSGNSVMLISGFPLRRGRTGGLWHPVFSAGHPLSFSQDLTVSANRLNITGFTRKPASASHCPTRCARHHLWHSWLRLVRPWGEGVEGPGHGGSLREAAINWACPN